MYAAAESLPGVPVPRPSSRSLARNATSALIAFAFAHASAARVPQHPSPGRDDEPAPHASSPNRTTEMATPRGPRESGGRGAARIWPTVMGGPCTSPVRSYALSWRRGTAPPGRDPRAAAVRDGSASGASARCAGAARRGPELCPPVALELLSRRRLRPPLVNSANVFGCQYARLVWLLLHDPRN